MKAKKGKLRWFKWAVLAVILAGVAVVVTAWMMFQHIPAWYQPMQVPPEDRQRVRDDFVITVDRLGTAMNKSPGPFEFRFTQDQINAWIATREHMWPDARRWLPEYLSEPQILFSPDGVRLAAYFHHGSIQSILSARLEIQAGAQGIFVRLRDVQGGSLELPQSRIRQMLADLDGRSWPAGRRVSGQIGDRPLPRLSSLFDGVLFPGQWIWQNGKQPFRVTRIAFEPGAMVVTFEPLARSGR